MGPSTPPAPGLGTASRRSARDRPPASDGRRVGPVLVARVGRPVPAAARAPGADPRRAGRGRKALVVLGIAARASRPVVRHGGHRPEGTEGAGDGRGAAPVHADDQDPCELERVRSRAGRSLRVVPFEELPQTAGSEYTTASAVRFHRGSSFDRAKAGTRRPARLVGDARRPGCGGRISLDEEPDRRPGSATGSGRWSPDRAASSRAPTRPPRGAADGVEEGAGGSARPERARGPRRTASRPTCGL